MIALPDWITVLERGWLSANSVLIFDRDTAVMVDSGYAGHADQTLALVDHALAGRKLGWLVNTHCHSDHMGGNARVQTRHACRTSLPAGEAPLIDRWDARELLLDYADQRADRFRYDDTFDHGDSLRMGGREWHVIGTPGHDPHAVVFWEPEARVLISGDALWQAGFGVVFGALMGRATAFDEARLALERIRALDARIVIPGHGAVFDDVAGALERALTRLEYYAGDIERLARHCMKALFTYALLDKRRMPIASIPEYLARVEVYVDLNERFVHQTPAALAHSMLADLERVGVVGREGGDLVPRIRA